MPTIRNLSIHKTFHIKTEDIKHAAHTRLLRHGLADRRELVYRSRLHATCNSRPKMRNISRQQLSIAKHKPCVFNRASAMSKVILAKCKSVLHCQS